jgi:hypothetical protein
MRPQSILNLVSNQDSAIFASLLVFSVAFYARAVGFDFVRFDDPQVLLAHPNLYDETDFLSSLSQIFAGYLPREEPLMVRDISWAIDARLFGFRNPAGYHLGNVLLNGLAVGLFFVFLRQMRLERWMAAGVALAFALLPVHVEPVSWVMGRKDLLAAVFMLAALIAQGIEFESNIRWRRYLAYGATLLFTLLALGSKISSVVLFALLFVHNCFYSQRQIANELERSSWKIDVSMFIRVLPHAAISIGFFLWYRSVISAYGVLGQPGPAPFSLEHISRVLGFFPLILGDYVSHLAWPFELSAYYRWPHVAIPLTSMERLASVAWLVGIAGGLGLLFFKRRDLAFFGLWPLILLTPYCGLFYVGFWQADRYLYLASGGMLVLAAFALREAAARAPRFQLGVAAIGVVFLGSSGVLAWQQQMVWRDGETLWRYEAHRQEPSLLGIQGLAKIYVQRGEAATNPDERLEWARAALTEVQRGFVREAELGLVESPYRVPEQLQLARLHTLSGRIGALLGMPVADQVPRFRRAFELAPDRSGAIFLSRSLFMAAEAAPSPERERLIEESFSVFTDFVRLSTHDIRHLDESRVLLEQNYAGRFPYLNDEIASLRSTYYP